MKTLILVDMQDDFIPGGALGMPRGDQVISVTNRVMPAFNLVVAARESVS